MLPPLPAQIAFSDTGVGDCGNLAGATAIDVVASTADVSSALAAGVYEVCLSVDNTNWVLQSGVALTVVAAGANDVTAIAPAIVSTLSLPTVTATGLVPTPTSAIIFVGVGGACTDGDGLTLFQNASSLSEPMTTALTTSGLHDVCYAVDFQGDVATATWVKQPAVNITAIEASLFFFFFFFLCVL